MLTSFDIIKTLIRTEKATFQEPQGKYLFLVDMRANKIQIKKAIESIYKVKVVSINTSIVSGKPRIVRRELGKTPDWKKAYVTLKKGEKIEVT